MEEKQKWYHSNFGIIILLFIFFPLGFYFMWRYSKWDKKIKVGITVFLLLIFMTSGKITNSNLNPPKSDKKPSPEVANAKIIVSNNPLPTAISETELDYEIIDKNENNTVENYKVLTKPGEDGKAVALEVKKSCKKPCNIDVYDDKKALELQNEYDEMMGTLDTTPEEIQSWKEQNYTFVADHFIGYINFELEKYQDFPYKDWYYEELKSKGF